MELERFVKAEAMREVLEIAFASSTNVLLYGPAGHGKSEFVQAFFEAKGLSYGLGGDVFVKSLNGDTDEASLFGGLDFARLNDPEHPDLQYHLSRSFLAYEYAVFEEIFDAPASVLCALKDVLTSGFFRGGEQHAVMETRMVVGITNKSPDEVSELGPSAHALTERFPLRLEVQWESYRAEDYLELLEAVGPVHEHTELIARLAAEATAQGFFVSPRTAVHANRLCANGFGLAPLKYIEGFENLTDEVEEMLREQRIIREFRSQAAEFRAELDALPEETPEQCLAKARRAKELRQALSQLPYTEAVADERERLLDRFVRQRKALLTKAEDMV